MLWGGFIDFFPSHIGTITHKILIKKLEIHDQNRETVSNIFEDEDKM